MGVLNKDKIANYSKRAAFRAAEKAFSGGKVHVGASDLEQLLPASQSNAFLLEQIFLMWRNAKREFHLANFDNDAPAVKAAAEHYFNVLSRHFALDKLFVAQAAESAIVKTFALLLNPREYYEQLLLAQPETFNLVRDFSPQLKFILTHTELKNRVYDLLVSAASADGSISRELALRAVAAAFEQNSDFDDPKTILKEFSDFETLSLSDIYTEDDNASEEKIEDTPVFEKAEAVKIEENVPVGQSLVSLKNLIPSEREFDFIRVLFNDSRAEYTEAIDALDKINNYPEAIMYVKNNYFRKNSWDLEREEVKQFYEILSGRY